MNAVPGAQKEMHQMAGMLNDPIEVQVLWERCISMVDEAANRLVRAAFSTVARESNDFGCVLCDARGYGVAYTTRGTPRMGIILPRTIRAMLECLPISELKPGDILFSNDPWFGSGHLPDFYVAMPIFIGDKLVGFSGACSHVADVGGSLGPDAREVYEEGICFPPVKLYQESRRDNVIFSIIEKNVRVPEQVIGDLEALVASCRSTSSQLVELLQASGLDDLEELSANLATRTESAFRKAIEQVPDGTYGGVIEGDGFDDPVVLKCAITVRGSDIHVDCSGTSPQVSPGGINVVFNFTYSAFVYALKCILDPHTPFNEGMVRAITVYAPAQSILNAEFPAPVFARNQTAHYLPALVMDAMSKAVPSRVMAACGSPTNRTVFQGKRGHKGRPYSFMMISSGGMGACSDKDGYSCTPFPSNSGSPPVEVIESVVPLRINKKELRTDSGGAGEFRGGLGIELEIENVSSEPMRISTRMDRVKNPAEGLYGGMPGALAGIWLNGVTPIPSKGRGELPAGYRLVIHSPGGGGVGDPARRSPDSLHRDVGEGFVSEKAAQELYGDPGERGKVGAQ
jgi:N-methylhydantoinase B